VSATPPRDSAAARAADRRFLGLALDDGGRAGSALVTPALMSPRGSLYGGAGIALAIAMMEAATERALVWTTVQFVGRAPEGARLDLQADVAAHGHRTSQARVTAHVDGREIFTAVGSSAGTGGTLSGDFGVMPIVDPPEESAPIGWPGPEAKSRTHFGTTDFREPVARDDRGEHAPPRTTLWARVDGAGATPAMLGYIADLVPVSIRRALGASGGPMGAGGTSLDNSLRVGRQVDTDWVLMDLHPHIAVDGYGHGTAYLWSADGALLGIASQSFVLHTSTPPES
jgi:acyl-CoA thioesterase II